MDSELLSWGVQPSQINELPDENLLSRAEKLDMERRRSQVTETR